MALISGFDHDIFISYAHINNSKLPDESKGWVEQFYNYLTIELERCHGRTGALKVWWDTKKIDGNTYFDSIIEEGIKKSAIFLCLNSSGYKQSDYCKQELDAFHSKIQHEDLGSKIGHKTRIVHVLLNNMQFEEWPTELGGTTGFSFHDGKEKNDFGDPLAIGGEPFRIQMKLLKDSIWNLICDFKDESSTTKTVDSKNEKTTSSSSKSIFFAEVSDSLRSSRKRMVKELQKEGFAISDEVPPPFDNDGHKDAACAAIDQSMMTVHLLNEYPGREIDGAKANYYTLEQANLAFDANKKNIVWMPPQLDFDEIEDTGYRQFLTQLDDGKITSNQLEFIRCPKSELVQEIKDIAKQISAKATAVRPEDLAPLSVLLDTHVKDEPYAFELSRHLFEHQVQPFINPQQDDPRENIQLFANRLKQVKKLVFLYGDVSKDWILERMSAALELVITNGLAIEDFYVYMAPPRKNADDININQKLLKINVVDSSSKRQIDPKVLDQFLQDLKTTESV